MHPSTHAPKTMKRAMGRSMPSVLRSGASDVMRASTSGPSTAPSSYRCVAALTICRLCGLWVGTMIMIDD